MSEDVKIVQTEDGPVRMMRRLPCQHTDISHGASHVRCFCGDCGVLISNIKDGNVAVACIAKP